jgi:hypothetical protein
VAIAAGIGVPVSRPSTRTFEPVARRLPVAQHALRNVPCAAPRPERTLGLSASGVSGRARSKTLEQMDPSLSRSARKPALARWFAAINPF